MKMFLGAAALIAVCSAASAQVTHLGSYGGHEYYTTDSAMTIFNARTVAASLGGYVVAVNDQAENDFLVAATGGQPVLWIGLSDEVTEGAWLWDSGEPFAYSNWSPGEPNNVGNEDHVHMNWSSGGRWNDIPGTAGYRAIIEVVPGPGAASLLGLAGLAALRRRR